MDNFMFRSSKQAHSQVQDVHFHRGPQGQPVPCYEGVCPMPQLSPDDVREAAEAAKR